jgi:CheY-like chemotaxis protein
MQDGLMARLRRVAGRPQRVERGELDPRLINVDRNEAVARLAGGVAHDFNNLLTVILGYTDLVIGDLGPDHPSVADLEVVRRSGDQARALVDQLLTLSRRRVTAAEAVDPSATIASLRETIRRVVGEPVQVDLRLADGHGDVLIGAGQLEQVVLNLVVNAADAMPGGGRLTISTSMGQLPDGHRAVDLRVSDTGDGMDPSTAARCFEPFFTTKDRTEGTGLGLATVAAIVEAAGGRIAVETAPGDGTTFVVQLPAVARPPRAGQVDLDAQGGAERVLLVEDDAKVRGFAHRVLEQHGYATVDATNGVEALSLLRAGEHPDLVITDVLMPAMGGVELAQHVHGLAPATPVLFVSGFPEDARLHQKEGEVAFLAKPFSPDDLLRAVRRAIDGPARVDQGSNR